MMKIISMILCFVAIGIAQNKPSRTSGEIHGKISIVSRDELSEEIMHGRMMNRYGSGGSSNKPVEAYRLSEKAVVFIDSIGETGSYAPPAVHPQLNQRDLIFRPLTLPVVRGTTVDFPNNDNVFHNVFSYSKEKEFDLGRYPVGTIKSVTFDAPGIVNVYCEIHQYMYATILVLQNPFFALPEEDGSFVLRGIPEGTYQVSFWYGRKKVETRSVTVRANEVTAANFSF